MPKTKYGKKKYIGLGSWKNIESVEQQKNNEPPNKQSFHL